MARAQEATTGEPRRRLSDYGSFKCLARLRLRVVTLVDPISTDDTYASDAQPRRWHLNAAYLTSWILVLPFRIVLCGLIFQSSSSFLD